MNKESYLDAIDTQAVQMVKMGVVLGFLVVAFFVPILLAIFSGSYGLVVFFMGVCITTFFALKRDNKGVDIFITLEMSSYVQLAKKEILQKLLQKANAHLEKSRKDAALGVKDSDIEMMVAQKMITEIEEIIVSIGVNK